MDPQPADRHGRVWDPLPKKAGDSSTFFPDFLVWHADVVWAIDTTGPHLLDEKVRGKLISLGTPRMALVTRGTINPPSSAAVGVRTGSAAIRTTAEKAHHHRLSLRAPRFPKPRALVRFRPGAISLVLSHKATRSGRIVFVPGLWPMTAGLRHGRLGRQPARARKTGLVPANRPGPRARGSGLKRAR